MQKSLQSISANHFKKVYVKYFLGHFSRKNKEGALIQVYAVQGKYNLERDLPMNKIYQLMKNTDNLIQVEERIQQYMYDAIASLLMEMLEQHKSRSHSCMYT